MASPPPFSPGLIEPPAYGSSTNIHKINGQKILPLVSVPELKAHLLLLGAFHRLKTNVEEAEWFIFEKGSALPLMEVKWALFVERAVERFKIWLQRVVQRPERSKRPLAGREIPPLDVLMVLHTYLLSPYAFYEDGLRKFPELLIIGEFPLLIVASLIDMETMELQPTDEQVAYWTTHVEIPFDMPISTRSLDTVSICCPSCMSNAEVPWIAGPKSPKGKGYSQYGFDHTCESCGSFISHKSLRMYKFIKDLKQCDAVIDEDAQGVLATTLLHEPIGSATSAWGRVVTGKILTGIKKHLGNLATPLDLKRDGIPEIAEAFQWNLDRLSDSGMVEGAFQDLLRTGETRSARFFAAYATHQPFSVDLTTSVSQAHNYKACVSYICAKRGQLLRLGTFTDTVYALGWTAPGKFDIKPDELITAIDRYHKFLDVNSQNFRLVMTPSIDVDLVFHTHMLNHPKYRDDCVKFVGRVLDHHDAVEEGKMETIFYGTADEWKKRHKKVFSSCGCYHNVEVASVSLKFWKKKKDEAGPIAVGDAFKDADPPDHPSTHNSIIIFNEPRFEYSRRARQQRAIADSQMGHNRTSSKGKGTATKDEIRAQAKSDGHHYAFARPVDGNYLPFRKLGPSGWALRAPLDPRVVDGSRLGKGIHVYGADPTRSKDSDSRATQRATGWLA